MPPTQGPKIHNFTQMCRIFGPITKILKIWSICDVANRCKIWFRSNLQFTAPQTVEYGPRSPVVVPHARGGPACPWYYSFPLYFPSIFLSLPLFMLLICVFLFRFSVTFFYFLSFSCLLLVVFIFSFVSYLYWYLVFVCLIFPLLLFFLVLVIFSFYFY